MEPQVIPTTPTPPIQAPEPKPSSIKNSLLVIMAVCLLIATGLAGLFYFQIQKLSKQLASLQTQPSPTPTATTNPTANWKVLIDNQNGFSLKYPNTWDDPVKNQQSTRTEYNFVPQNLNITIGFNYNQDLQRPRTYEEEIADEEKGAVGKKTIPVGNQNTTEYINFIGSHASTIETTVLLKGTGDNIIRIDMTFPQGTDPSIFDQILSTFKFID